MGIYIGIKKYKAVNEIYYYLAKTDDFGGCHFYISLDPKQNSITFYQTNDFSKPLKIVDVNKKDETISIPDIAPAIMWRVIGKGMKSINENDFPNDISHCS